MARLERMPSDRLLALATGRGASVSDTQCVCDPSLAPAAEAGPLCSQCGRHNLDNCFAIDKPGFTALIGEEPMAKLSAFYDTFKELDGVEEYLARRQMLWGLPGSRARA